MGFFTRGRADTVLVLTIDVGSIGVLFLHLDKKNSIPLEVAEYPLNSSGISDLTSFNIGLEALLKEKLPALFAKHGRRPGRIFVLVQEPLAHSQITEAKYFKSESFEVTTALKDSLIRDDFEKLKRDGLPGRTGLYEQAFIIEHKIVETKLNGYATSSPIGKEAQTVEISIFTSILIRSVAEAISRALNQVAKGSPIFFRSMVRAAYALSQAGFTNEESFLLLLISGETTLIAPVSHNSLASIFSFPIGAETILRKISKETGKSKTELSSLISLAMNQSLTDKKEIEILREARSSWISEIGKLFLESAKVSSLPPFILASAPRAFAPWFFEGIKSEEFTHHFLTEKKFDVILMTREKYRYPQSVPKSLNDCPVMTTAYLFAEQMIYYAS